MSNKKLAMVVLAAVAAVCLAGLAGVHVALQALLGQRRNTGKAQFGRN